MNVYQVTFWSDDEIDSDLDGWERVKEERLTSANLFMSLDDAKIEAEWLVEEWCDRRELVQEVNIEETVDEKGRIWYGFSEDDDLFCYAIITTVTVNEAKQPR
jgi:hypothetical protein